MKKPTLIAIIVALLAAYPVAAWVTGRQIESGMTAYQNQLTSQFPYLKVTQRDYQRGMYSSTETITFEIMGELFRALGAKRKSGTDDSHGSGDATAEALKPVTITLRNHIKHGPFPGMSALAAAEIDSELVLDESTKQELAKVFGHKKPFEAHTLLKFGGGGTSTITSAALSTTWPNPQNGGEPLKVSWQGTQLKVDFAKDIESFAVDGSAPSLELSEGLEKSVRMSGLKYQAQQKRVYSDEPLLYAGKQVVTVSELAIASPQEKTQSMRLKDLKYEIDVTANGDFIDAGARMGAAEFSIDKQNYGPVHNDISMKHLHGRTLAKLWRAMIQMYSDANIFTQDAQAATAALEPLTRHAMDLLKHNPELSLDRISFKTVDGEAKLSARAKLDGASGEDFVNPMALIPKLDASADIALPHSLLAQMSGSNAQASGKEQAMRRQMMEEQLNAFTQQGYVTQEGNLLKTRLEFKAGQLSVNGKPFNLDPAVDRLSSP